MGAEKTWYRGVDCATGVGDVYQCLEPCPVLVRDQSSVLSLLLFIIVLEALSRKFHSGVHWEDLYADDLVIIAESLKECVSKLLMERNNGGERTDIRVILPA